MMRICNIFENEDHGWMSLLQNFFPTKVKEKEVLVERWVLWFIFFDSLWKLYWERYIVFTIMNTLNLEWVLWYKLTMCYIYQHIAHCHCYLNEMQIVLISHPQNVKHFLSGIKRVAMQLHKHFLSLLWLSGVKLCISGLLFHGWYEI